MWRDQLDAFWDGRRAFLIGFFKGEDASRATGPRPDLVIVSASDAKFADAMLLDIVDARRWRCGHCVFDLPQDHNYVSLHSPDGSELRFELMGEDSSLVGGEWRLLLAELPESAPNSPIAFRLASMSARGGWERLARDQIARSGARLVWAICQKRRVERRDGAAIITELWPAHRVFPAHQSRIVIEAADLTFERYPNMQKAPFAVMENWLRENGAPCVALRIQIPNARDQGEFVMGRIAIALIMHQRRRLRDWIRERRTHGEPIADSLGFEDIRTATGCLLEEPEAVESSATIIAHNLLSVTSNSETSEFDGVAVRRASDGAGADSPAHFDVYFFGAALGDDVGLVSASASIGDFGVVPSDPGGAPYVRLFRVESDGLQPRRVDDDDILLDEILRLASAKEITPTAVPDGPRAEPIDSFQNRREAYLAILNSALVLADYDGRLHGAKLWDIFEPALLTSFVAMAEDADPEARAALLRIGGFEAYQSDPSLTQAMLQSDFARTLSGTSFKEYCGASKSIVHRFVGACRIAGLVAADADARTQIQCWHILAQPLLATHLATARITLAGTDDIPQKINHIAASLVDEAIVDRAALFCANLRLEQEAEALRQYVARRNRGEWTSLSEAERLSLMVEEANAYWRRIEQKQAISEDDEAPPQVPAKSAGIFAAVRNFFARGRSRS
jgi:hypothetical protein